ncbi:anaerobic ribonucleoside-triphosphate reductase [Halobacteriovorax sp. HLS]|uniref:anaerobic ribonucleoside-triphosphate reductase n=1 Tax=Halobacteriovorax sp. HLS TaxID=2234000 RepID=UPI000FDC7D6A|nr:anaerobic ribonucleoside-triphosphate reductase [Halobacteriovorax sp. HLS]
MLKLTEEQIENKIDFIKKYQEATNAASGSKFDANANVSFKNIATLEAEINKDINIQVNRRLISNEIRGLFGEDLAKEYNRQIEEHEIYVHDETSLKPYCVSISMYPFLLDGMKKLGGESLAPEHLESFCGSFINLIFAVSSQFAGAVATVEFLMYFDHFARKDYGDAYFDTHRSIIENHFQHVVYSINQPAAARGYQSVFWNISLFDEEYFNTMFADFSFPNFDKPKWESVFQLQKLFMKWFNQERQKAVLTFPVVTAAMLVDDEKPIDDKFADFCCEELAQGNSFFIYQSKSADSLASCCRLRNEISQNTFSYSLGAGGVATGSINVITINLNRLIQQGRSLKEQVKNIHKYQVAYRSLMQKYKEASLLPVYDAGFIDLNKQFLTIGINGMVEAAEYLGIQASDNTEYTEFVRSQLKVIYDENISAKKEYGYMFNTEFVPAENLGPKNAKWDSEDGFITKRSCYNSYFYPVESLELNALDKFKMHGREMNEFLDGGSALHLNLEEHLSKENYRNLLNISARTGCNYFCTNILVTICNDCHFIDKRTLKSCSKCSSTNIDHGTRVIGYLKRISSFSNPRQSEHDRRYYLNHR